MALQADNQGFLTGEVVSDIRRMTDQLRGIRADVAAIKRAVIGGPATGGENRRSRSSSGSSNARPARQDGGEAQNGQNNAGRNSGHEATPNRANGGNQNPNSRNTSNRDASGRFIGGSSNAATPGSRQSENQQQATLLNGVADRIGNAINLGAEGLEEADPAIKAFQEVAEPMKRGYQVFFGGGDKKERWFRKIFKELNLFRRDETAFNRAANRSLHNIEENPGGSGEGEGGQSFLGGLLGSISPWVMTAITGIGTALLSGIGVALGVIFSPIGLAIGVVATAAWGLFTESGQKFFGEVGAKIIAGWDSVVTTFVPITESISKGWDMIKGKFDSLIGGMVSSWDTFTAFLKDKFGIDIPAIFKPVVDVSKKVIEGAKETINKGADVAKKTASKASDVVEKSSPKTTEAISNVWNSAKEGAENISRRAKFNEVDAALNFQGDGQITGLSDVQTRALAANTAKTESGGKVDADNKQGYFGQYQFGAEALVESGLVKQDKLAEAKKASGKDWYKKRNSKGEIGGHEAFLRDKSNWNTEGGLDSFLQDKGAQDKAFLKYTNKNVAGGMRSGAISKDDSAENIAGYAKAAHLKGVGGANRLFKNGIESFDGNHTSTAAYAKQGATAMTETVNAINAKAGEAPPAVASIADDPIQGGRYKYEPLEGGKIQKTDNETGVTELASEAESNAFRKNQGQPYLDKVASINAMGTQSASMPMPSPPRIPTAPPIDDSPGVVAPMGSGDSKQNIMVSLPAGDVGQDVRDRGIAHIVTGGLSGRG